jgi:hypothetical protein
MERNGERTLHRVNKPTTLFGIAPMELVLMVAIILVPILVTVWSAIVTFPCGLYAIKKLSQAKKNGCPDYLSELSNSINVKTSFEDKDQVMKKLKQNG